MNDSYIIYNGQLYHHGVKGMKWGVRRNRRKARAAYRAASNAIGKKRRDKFLDKARKYDETADNLERKMKSPKDEYNPNRSTAEKVARKALKGIGTTAKVTALVGTAAVAAGAVYVKKRSFSGKMRDLLTIEAFRNVAYDSLNKQIADKLGGI